MPSSPENPSAPLPGSPGDHVSNLKALGPFNALWWERQRSPSAPAGSPISDGPLRTETLALHINHLSSSQERLWWQNAFKRLAHGDQQTPVREIYELLALGEGFEAFCHQQFPGQRRFSLQGLESLAVALEALFQEAKRQGIPEITLGMAHRGRLNLTGSLFGRDYAHIFGEFLSPALSELERPHQQGDVKYHSGANYIRERSGRRLEIRLLPNPSHLEAIGPVVNGFTRGRNALHEKSRRSLKKSGALGVILHGDAAFAGQGVVYENFQMEGLKHYAANGSIHLIANNRIGFTTSPENARATKLAGALGLAFECPLIEIDAEDPETLWQLMGEALRWRQLTGRSLIIDLQGSRRLGHNETDNPAFTQPREAERLKNHPTAAELFQKKLERDNRLSAGESAAIREGIKQRLREELKKARARQKALLASPAPEGDAALLSDRSERIAPMTGVPFARLAGIVSIFSPQILAENFGNAALHPRIQEIYAARTGRTEPDSPIDWATAESLALGSIALDGHPIRLSGQDSGRGTFSHRHLLPRDQKTGKILSPLSLLGPHQGEVEIVDSPLSEYAALAFELGYSIGNPNGLTLWEAQFGDFANGAQIVIDEFLAGGETKWDQKSALTLLLPHGLEGAGPDHSSARIERFLQLCGENNLRLANPTTPANYFHLLRRQMLRQCPKPLVVFTPKSLLRHPKVFSLLSAFGPRTRFRPILAETALKPEGIERLILCSGKIYYDLLARQEALQDAGTDMPPAAIIRIEQLYPFPMQEIRRAVKPYARAQEILWCQEEPRNMGAWNFIREALEQAFRTGDSPLQIRYAGRNAAAAPAAGSAARHLREQEALLDSALL